jgi:hypothetical protein
VDENHSGAVQSQAKPTAVLKVRTGVRAGGLPMNHNEALKFRTGVRAGGTYLNHSETLKVRTGVKAGGLNVNHNESTVIVGAR